MRVEITNRAGEVIAHAQVDDCDAPLVRNRKWILATNGGCRYAVTTVDGRQLLMHRILLGLKTNDRHVDHIDGDGLNNTRSNIRVVSHAENMQNRRLHRNNTSGYRAVSFDKKNKKWRARVQLNGRTNNVGTFPTPEAAGEAAARWRRENMPYAVETR